MLRKIITIDPDKCNGCGLCVSACHEGALKLIDGKAKLISDTYCDGLGACLPECPVKAISIEEREAGAFDEKATLEHLAGDKPTVPPPLPCGCPGSQAKLITPAEKTTPREAASCGSMLRQWPCQLKLVPANAAYFDNAHLLVAADCSAYAYANLHADFMRNKITVIGCPKLDNTEYAEKLTEILKLHDIKSVTVLRMEVPCCGGLVNSVKQALLQSGKLLPWSVVTISTDGKILDD